MNPIILHSDMNNFYASVEILYDPSLKGKPVAVAGDEEAHHGIVLAKNDVAKQFGIHTIGALARTDKDFLYSLLGKNGIMLHRFANGQDHSGVRQYYAVPPMKSIGNSTTAPRDLLSEDDVKITLMALCESVAARLREQNCVCSTVTVGIRTNDLASFDRQLKLSRPTDSTLTIWEAAMDIFRHSHTNGRPVRSFSIKVSGLAPADEMMQLSLFPEDRRAQHRADIDRTMDKIRAKYGYFSIRRAIILVDPALDLDAKGDHIIHPVGFLGTL